MQSRKWRTRVGGAIAVTAVAVLAAGTAAVAGAGSDAGVSHRAGPATTASAPSVALAVATHGTPPTSGARIQATSPGDAHGSPSPPVAAAHLATKVSPSAHGGVRSSAPTTSRPTGSGPTHTVPDTYSVPSAAQLVAGVGPVSAGWVTTAHALSVAGLSRLYLTIEPAHPAPSLPIVLLLHGRGMTPDSLLRISGLADRIGPAVLVVPAGWDRSWNAGDCCGAAYRAGVDDVAFIRAVLAHVRSSYPGAATANVYAVGFSNGGRLAYLLACQMPDVLTGFVAVEAVPVETCTPPRPLDMTIVAQQSDPLLTVDAGRPKLIYGFTEPTVAATVSRMAAADDCTGHGVATDVGLSMERTWTCAGGTHLRYVWYPAGGHDWRPPTTGTPGATDFVLQLVEPGAPGPPQVGGRSVG